MKTLGGYRNVLYLCGVTEQYYGLDNVFRFWP